MDEIESRLRDRAGSIPEKARPVPRSGKPRTKVTTDSAEQAGPRLGNSEIGGGRETASYAKEKVLKLPDDVKQAASETVLVLSDDEIKALTAKFRKT